MPLKILEVHARGQAAKAGIKSGDTILSINGMEISDFFDLEYYANDYQLDFELSDAEGKTRELSVFKQPGKALGIEPEPHQLTPCANRCVFCFIDQLPPGLRPSLYEKDDDYLFSYVFGNFITLNNLGKRELERIVNQHISPLYVSVHCSNPKLRQNLMGSPREFDVLKTLRALSRKGISFHLQIVCVPGYNCGDELRQSLEELLDGRINTLSVGVVPVGLTAWREKLTRLEPFDGKLAAQTIEIIDEYRENHPLVQAADELFILAGIDIPNASYYGDFPQLENGIGMTRLSWMRFGRRRRALTRELDKSGASCVLITSLLAASNLEAIAVKLNKGLERSSVRVKPIENRFLGGQVNVSGLLSASDILAQHGAKRGETVILPSNVFNHDGLSLDEVSQIELRDKLGRNLLVIDQYFEDWDWI